MRTVIYLCALILVLAGNRNACSQTITSDSLAVVALYDSTGGPSWNFGNSNWKQGPLSSWHGIAISQGRIVAVEIPGAGAAGQIPKAFFSLSALVDLDLRNNSFSGNLYPEVGLLGQIVNFRLYGSSFNSKLPAELGALVNLEVLDLLRSKFPGPIPTELGNLSRLRVLGLQQTDVTGNLPSELSGLISLEILDLAGNPNLTGLIPSEYTQLTSLQSFFFQLTGLCEPDSEDFQQWISSVPVVTSSGCIDTRLDEYPTQSHVVQLRHAYPNPFSNQVTIPFTLKRSGSIELTLFDLLGREATIPRREYYYSGNNQIVLNTRHLAPGHYTYVILHGTSRLRGLVTRAPN